MISDVRRAWQVAAWFDKLCLVIWSAFAILYGMSGDWFVAGLAVLLDVGDLVALGYKADAVEWRAKFQATRSAPVANYITVVGDVDEAVRNAAEVYERHSLRSRSR